MRFASVLFISLAWLFLANFAHQSPLEQSQGEPSQTPTFAPTLTDGQEEFETLLQTNGGCELPCWWGFIVGESTQNDWFHFLDTRTFHVFREEPIDGKTVPVDYAYFSFPNSADTAVTIHYQFDKSILTQLQITLNNPRQWLSPQVGAVSLPHLLSSLEDQPEVYIFSGSTPLDYGIVLIDHKIGLMAKYTFDFWDAQRNQETYPKQLSICLSMAYTSDIEITIQSPNVEPPLGVDVRPHIRAQERQTYIPVEEATFGQVDAREFIEFFRAHPNGCLTLFQSTG